MNRTAMMLSKEPVGHAASLRPSHNARHQPTDGEQPAERQPSPACEDFPMSSPRLPMPATGPAPSASQSSTAMPSPRSESRELPAGRPFGRELTALPDELFDHDHLVSRCQAQAFTQDRFVTSIAPWLNRFDSHLTKLLENCYEHEAFPCLARAAVGTQLCKAGTLQLEECEAIAEKTGVMVCVAPGCYELLSPQTAPNSDELCVDIHQEDMHAAAPHQSKGCLGSDQKHFVRLGEQTASLHEQRPDGIWCEVLRLEHENPVLLAEWSPSGQQLLTLSDTEAKVWSKAPDNQWRALITRAQPGRSIDTCTCFSPDDRTFLLQSNAVIHVWWRADDNGWTPSRFLNMPDTLVNQIAFSLDGRTMAMRAFDSQRSPAQVLIWSRTPQGDWQNEGRLVVNSRSDALIALPGNLAHAGKIEEVDCNRWLAIKLLALSIHRQLAVGYEMRLPTDDPLVPPQRACVDVWDLSSQHWKRQAQHMEVKQKCCEHFFFDREEPCGLLENLFFSPDGRFLVAKDICGRVQAWCLVPPAARSSNTETHAENKQDATL
ncbi:MAG: WD40 repeat domain-containing protein [Kistimonas sp.]|nr:WD40 repeat domain-containing protein [Kistimonas sp.]